MTLRTKLVATALAFSSTGCAAQSLSADDIQAQYTRNLQASDQSSAVLSEVASSYPALGVTVYEGEKRVWSRQVGYASIEDEVAANKETKFNAYSTAKALTGLAFARLVERGAVSLDAQVGTIAPDLPEHFHSITLRNLLSHTSGIRHYSSREDWLAFAMKSCATPREAITHFENDPLLHAPGAQESYSTFAFILASELLMRVTGAETFASAVSDTLGDWANYTLDSAGAHKATPYVKAQRIGAVGPGIEPDDFVKSPIESNECKFGGGGLLLSSDELARAGAALASGEIIPRQHLMERLQAWSEVSGVVYGGGVRPVTIRDKTYTAFNVSGAAPGGRSTLLVLVEPRIAVAIAGNAEGERLENAAVEIASAWVQR